MDLPIEAANNVFKLEDWNMRLFTLLTTPFQVSLSTCAIIVSIYQDFTQSPASNDPTATLAHLHHEHGLGLNNSPRTSSSKLDKSRRKKWDESYDWPPAPRPGRVSDSDVGNHLPRSIDWREPFGFNWITAVQNSMLSSLYSVVLRVFR
ncbi:uncharacterized protein K460DRAFT_63555 [Cucurbitaria berberidis CBS 394.84]|uniref:Uncharacterized protein n=1 Tax=Cucurbitaria berberidis CBS 394.84 TaxID=1168544 RepID=A0A9P4GM57_9PLEO|nr:uncharacterized protein K460DRAFT_63555 [Cucurbitaria berberidis CBS 394.84]KAF1847752.1 hypothetical protein K460DRAFT_63555 [Cucurbitaria berberidis CBS 394.84]